MDRASRGKQIKIYVGKCFRVFVHEHGWKLFISTAIITLLIAFVIDRKMMFEDYVATRNGVFALTCGCIWIGIFNSIQSVCKERDIIKREHRSGLHISSYVLAHTIFELVISFVESVIVTILFCIFFASNMPEQGIIMPLVIELWLAFFFTIFASDTLGLMVSSIVKTPTTAMTVMPFVLIIQLVMSGFIFELKGVMDTVSYLTVSKWNLNALCTSLNVNALGENNPFVHEMYELHKNDYIFETGPYLLKFLVLIGFIVLYTVISIISLHFVDKDKR
ncbi:MAG: ABC transporter permease [Clostridia bacterium]|nr:ABC transporter permease [Clostridia bacterium]